MNEETQEIALGRGGVADVAARLGHARGKAARPTSRLADAMAFLRGFLARPREVASVVPSSVFLEASVVRAANLHGARTVVELGPGTGGTTRALLRSMMPQSRLLALELNAGFCERLARLVDDPRLAVHAGSAEDLPEVLRWHGLPAADTIVSGIPFSTLPPDVAERVAAAIAASLAPGGRFVAYQLRAHVGDFVAPHLGSPHVAWEWRALPPMRVFVWDKPAQASAEQRLEPGRALAAADIGPQRSAP